MHMEPKLGYWEPQNLGGGGSSTAVQSVHWIKRPCFYVLILGANS